jgi:hypothetical protein
MLEKFGLGAAGSLMTGLGSRVGKRLPGDRHELPNSPHQVQSAIRILWLEPLVVVIVPAQNQISTVVIEGLNQQFVLSAMRCQLPTLKL